MKYKCVTLPHQTAMPTSSWVQKVQCQQAYRDRVAHIKNASALFHLSLAHMNPASAMKTKRKTAHSAAVRRSTPKSR